MIQLHSREHRSQSPPLRNFHKVLIQPHIVEADSTIKKNYNLAACRKIRNTLNKLNKMKRQRNMHQMKEHAKNSPDQTKNKAKTIRNKTKQISSLPDKKYKIMIVKVIQNLRNKMEA